MRKNNIEFKDDFILNESEKFAVDNNSGIISGVKLVGFNSKNNRVYTKACLREALGLYEGKPVNLNHTPVGDEVRVEDRLGKVTNVRMTDSGIYGDLHFLRTHPMSERILEAAEKMPELFGFSQRSIGTVKFNKNGPEEVSKIKNVLSVDLVSDPATTKSLMESVMQPIKEEEEKSSDKKCDCSCHEEYSKMQEDMDGVKKLVEEAKACLESDMSPEDKLAKLHDLLGVDTVKEEEEMDKEEEKKESVTTKIDGRILCEAAGIHASDDLVSDLNKLDADTATKMVRRLAESKFKPATKNSVPVKAENRLSGNELARYLLS